MSALVAHFIRPWPARAFARRMMAVVGAFIALCVTANLLIDPYGVFGTDLLSSHISTNYRHRTYARYLRERADIDTIIVGSSRVGLAFDPATAQAALPGRRVAQLWAQAGTVSDALPIVRAVLRDRDHGLNRVNAVVLVMDLQLIGTNYSPFGRFSQNHPAVGDESRIAVYAGYLFHLDYNQMIRKFRHSRAIGPHDLNLFRGTVPVGPAYRVEGEAPPAQPEDILARDHAERHFAALAEIAAMTRARGVRLEVIAPPMAPSELARLTPASVAGAIERMRRITPIWRFETPAWLGDDPALWLDLNHYVPSVAAMMLSRVFDTGHPPVPAGFGVRLSGGASYSTGNLRR